MSKKDYYSDKTVEDVLYLLSVFGNIEAILHYMVTYQRFEFSVETVVPNSDEPMYSVEFKLGKQYFRSEWEFNLADAVKGAFDKYKQHKKEQTGE